MKRGWRTPLAVLSLVAATWCVVRTQILTPSTSLPSPGFHHIHMNSVNPQAAIAEFLTIYPASTRVTVAGFEGLRTANDVSMLFTRVSKAPPAPGPDRVTAKAPQTRSGITCGPPPMDAASSSVCGLATLPSIEHE